jgi:site-specific recombinase XerD
VDISIEQMKRDLTRGEYANSTRDAYLKEAMQLVEFLGCPIAEVTRDQLRVYVDHLVETVGNTSTIRARLSAVRFLFRNTLGTPEMVSFIRIRGRKPALPEILNLKEVEALIKAIHSYRIQSIAMVMYGAGLRIAEAIALTVDDIDSSRGVIRVLHGKGDVAREAKLSPVLCQWLRDYWAKTRPTMPHLFANQRGQLPRKDTIRYALCEAAKEAGIKKRVTPHLLRHSFATHLLEAGTDVNVVRVLLGHKSIRTTTRYAQVTNKLVRETPSPVDLLPIKLR